jgi:hypothetical protein
MQDVVVDDKLERFRHGYMKLHHHDKRSSLFSNIEINCNEIKFSNTDWAKGWISLGLFLNMVLSPFQLFLIFWLQKKKTFLWLQGAGQFKKNVWIEIRTKASRSKMLLSIITFGRVPCLLVQRHLTDTTFRQCWRGLNSGGMKTRRPTTRQPTFRRQTTDRQARRQLIWLS